MQQRPAQRKEHLIEIPSFGLEFFEYRRALFLAGQPPPIPPPDAPFPLTYLVPSTPPPPIPYEPKRPSPKSSIGRLEALLDRPGADEDEEVWTSSVEGVWRKLDDRKRLARPIRLGLIIRILRAGWVRDGTWPVDPRTSRAAVPPASPEMSTTALPAVRPVWMRDSSDQATAVGSEDGSMPATLIVQDDRGTGKKRQNKREDRSTQGDHG